MEIDETVLSSSPKLDLLIIAYRPSQLEVEALFACIQKLSPYIRYSIALNAAILEIENLLTPLFENALIVQRNSDNIGYGRAANNLFLAINQPAPWVAVLNTDLYWQPGSFETLLGWLTSQHDVVAAVPQILSPSGQVERLTKRDPSFIALCSRRFVPEWLKPVWLRRLDARFTMDDQNLHSIYSRPAASSARVMRLGSPGGGVKVTGK